MAFHTSPYCDHEDHYICPSKSNKSHDLLLMVIVKEALKYTDSNPLTKPIKYELKSGTPESGDIEGMIANVKDAHNFLVEWIESNTENKDTEIVATMFIEKGKEMKFFNYDVGEENIKTMLESETKTNNDIGIVSTLISIKKFLWG